jgi:predicted Zn-dependent peptidase
VSSVLKRLHSFLLRAIAGLCLAVLLGLSPLSQGAYAQASQTPLQQLASRLSEFRLENGIRFVVLERHRAPVVSVVTYARVGAIDEPLGQTGVAHFLEHLAFKGTPTIGTLNYQQEEPLLTQLDQTFLALRRAEANGEGDRISALRPRFEVLKSNAAQLVQPNELGRILESAGAVGLNAATSADATQYYCSLPANKLELWMALESERFRQPVFREFFEEKSVILEERRLRLDNQPMTQLLEAVKAAALPGHPYARPVIGERQDIEALSPSDVRQFFQKHYGTENLTVAIVGDVQAQQVHQLAQQYFGPLAKRAAASRPAPQKLPPLTVTPRIQIQADTQPWYVEAYRIPPETDPDFEVLALLQRLLSQGRLGWLEQSLVEQQHLAAVAESMVGYPGTQHANLFVVYAAPAAGRQIPELEWAIAEILERLKTTAVPEADLLRVKNQLQASLLRSLDSNHGMAQLFAEYVAESGSSHQLFADLDRLGQITPADLQRVAQRIFRSDNRVVGELVSRET